MAVETYAWLVVVPWQIMVVAAIVDWVGWWSIA